MTVDVETMEGAAPAPRPMRSPSGPLPSNPGAAAVAARGWLAAHTYLIARRSAQIGFLALFLAGPWLGIWIVKGTLAASLTFDTLPLTDPLVLLQGVVAGHLPQTTAITGAAIVLVAYLLLGGRVYCSWFCPVNLVTDASFAIARRLGIPKGWQPRTKPRLALLAVALLMSAATGVIAWEQVNPVPAVHQALLFGSAGALMLVAAVFLFDLLVSRHGWCSALCPVGAFYGLLGSASLLRVSAARRKDCDHCMDCYAVCPEPQVIAPALRGEDLGRGPVILAGACTNCGACIDVCPTKVFRFTHRFDHRVSPATVPSPRRDAA